MCNSKGEIARNRWAFGRELGRNVRRSASSKTFENAIFPCTAIQTGLKAFLLVEECIWSGRKLCGDLSACFGRECFAMRAGKLAKQSQSFWFDQTGNCIEHSALSMRHTISVLVENKFGVLTRIAGMFSGRGFNIDSLNVAPTQDPSMSRMTLVVRGNDRVLDQVVKQLNKLVDVIEIQDFRENEYVDRELILLRVNVDSHTRPEVMQICDIFRAKIVDVQPKSLTVEITGNESKVEKFILLMEPFGISDLTRTGRVALARKE